MSYGGSPASNSKVSTATTRHPAGNSRTAGHRRSQKALHHCGVHHVDWTPLGVRHDLIEDIGELNFELISRDVADVRRAYDIGHREQRVIRIAQRLFLINIDRGHCRASDPQRVHEGAWFEELSSAGIDQQRGRLHPHEVRCGDDAGGFLD